MQHEGRTQRLLPPPARQSQGARLVRAGEGDALEFRLWQAEYPEVWEKHDWPPLSVIRQAALLYRERDDGTARGDPLALYDETVAKALLREA